MIVNDRMSLSLTPNCPESGPGVSIVEIGAWSGCGTRTGTGAVPVPIHNQVPVRVLVRTVTTAYHLEYR